MGHRPIIEFSQSVINIAICLSVFEGPMPSSKELHTVFYALIVSRILYALSAWGNYLTADLIGNDAYLCLKPSDGVIMAILIAV